MIRPKCPKCDRYQHKKGTCYEPCQDIEAYVYELENELTEVLDYAGHSLRCSTDMKCGFIARCSCGWGAMREKHLKEKR